MDEQNSRVLFELQYLEDQMVPSEYINDARMLLSSVVFGGFSVVFQEPELPIAFISKGLLEMIEETNYSNVEQFLQIIHPDDRDNLLEAVINCGSSGYEIEYRAIKKDGSCLWIRDQGISVKNMDGRAAVLTLHIDITDMVILREKLEQETKEYEENNRILAMITSNAPCGICEVALDRGFTLLYANKCCYDFFGYTPKQLKEEQNNQLIKLIWSDDLPVLKTILQAAASSNNRGFEVEHRIQQRDGTIRWVMASANFSDADGKKSAYCVLIDTTGRKMVEERLRMNEERFRIALEMTDNTIFDYDIHTKRMLHGDKSAEQYGLSKWTDNVPESLVESGVVHAKSAKVFLEMYQKIRDGEAAASCITQTKRVTGEYVWRKISMKTVFDGDGNAVRAVGFLEDIDDQKRREEALLELAERDMLTGVLNKGTTEARVANSMKEAPNRKSALMILDIDNFKLVNDSYGHLFGDHVIAESAHRLVQLFSTEDIVGRIGGDEFVVFIKSYLELNVIKDAARKIFEAFQSPFSIDGEITDVSCSIGIALFPAHGTTFDRLYANADTAMYHAKKQGKNQFRIYNAELG